MTPGEMYSEEFVIDQQQVERFAEVSGDRNPIHFDPEYAAKTIFKKPIVHGMIGAAFFSRILGNSFPGEGTIYRKQSLSFSRPMYVGEQYTVTLTLLSVDTEKGSAVMDTQIRDGEGVAVLSGEAIVYNPKFKADETEGRS